MEEENKNFNNVDIKHTFLARGQDVINANILIARQAFLLERYDFDKIIKSEGVLYNISVGLMGSAIALLINILAKGIGAQLNKDIKVDAWELYAFLIALILMIAAIVIDRCVPNERRRIIKKISNYYKEN